MRATKPTARNLRNAIDSTCCDRPQVRTATEVLAENEPDQPLPDCQSIRKLTFRHLPCMYLKQKGRNLVSLRASEFTPAELRAIADDLERGEA